MWLYFLFPAAFFKTNIIVIYPFSVLLSRIKSPAWNLPEHSKKHWLKICKCRSSEQSISHFSNYFRPQLRPFCNSPRKYNIINHYMRAFHAVLEVDWPGPFYWFNVKFKSSQIVTIFAAHDTHLSNIWATDCRLGKLLNSFNSKIWKRTNWGKETQICENQRLLKHLTCSRQLQYIKTKTRLRNNALVSCFQYLYHDAYV